MTFDTAIATVTGATATKIAGANADGAYLYPAPDDDRVQFYFTPNKAILLPATVTIVAGDTSITDKLGRHPCGGSFDLTPGGTFKVLAAYEHPDDTDKLILVLDFDFPQPLLGVFPDTPFTLSPSAANLTGGAGDGSSPTVTTTWDAAVGHSGKFITPENSGVYAPVANEVIGSTGSGLSYPPAVAISPTAVVRLDASHLRFDFPTDVVFWRLPEMNVVATGSKAVAGGYPVQGTSVTVSFAPPLLAVGTVDVPADNPSIYRRSDGAAIAGGSYPFA